MERRSALAKRPQEVSAELWMIPYADLMTNMMILFLALYALTVANTATTERTLQRAKEAFKGEMTAEESLRLRESELAVKLEETLRGLALTDFGVRVTSRFIHLTLPSPVLFSEGGYRLTKGSRRVLAPLGELFSTVPNTVLVGGHTDSQRILSGSYKTNWELSAARAFSVIEFFTGQGMAPQKFQVRGYGEHRPIASNNTEKGRAQNRRIEIRIVREVKTSS
ncbi:MAG: hypothetical protein COB53_10295 [Elusimicrobia bacterium]|nr:MAG: hypothetical protein COB53_10295 [Elusimicrobiota bacterium]